MGASRTSELQFIIDEDEISFELNGEQVSVPCRVGLQISSRPELLFVCDVDDPLISVRFLRQKVPFEVYFKQADVRCSVFPRSTGNPVLLTPTREPIQVGESSQIQRVSFHILNFPSFYSLDSHDRRFPKDELDIEVDGWHVELRPSLKSPQKEAIENQLFSITHSGSIVRRDESVFTSADVSHFLSNLQNVLSFAAGHWVSSLFVEGLDKQKQVVWKEWGAGRVHPREGRIETWFSVHHAFSLGELFGGILEVSKDTSRHEVFTTALYWYIRSSGTAAGVDGGIILLQAALERLAWVTFVIDKKSLSPDGFKRLPKEDQIRLLLDTCSIPTEIPEGLLELKRMHKGVNWQDGPSAIVGARNYLVHPAPRKEIPYPDIWRLAEWYVELVMLKMVDYRGIYSNRTKAERWVGDAEPVPWAQSEE